MDASCDDVAWSALPWWPMIVLQAPHTVMVARAPWRVGLRATQGRQFEGFRIQRYVSLLAIVVLIVSIEVSIGKLLVVARCCTFCKYSPVDNLDCCMLLCSLNVYSTSCMCISPLKWDQQRSP